MPYRIDISNPPVDILERLTSVDVLDFEQSDDGFSALIADSTLPGELSLTFGETNVQISDAQGRDDDSVWRLRLQPFNVGRWRFCPGHVPEHDRAIALGDGRAFGTGLHPTTSLCLELLDGIIEAESPHSMMDVGTGSGILALAALQAGVTRVAALDVDFDALIQTKRSAHVNGLHRGLALIQGEPAAVGGAWPLVFANILPAVLIEMASTLAPRVARNGRLVLSGIQEALAADVEHAYVRCGMRHGWSSSKAGWRAIVLTPSW